jgi:hypothetical protein
MKTPATLLALALSILPAAAMPPAVGSVAANQDFARSTASGFTNTDLEAYGGNILVVMLMTPWCPICQSHSQAVGSGLLDHFADSSRAALTGKNDNGVPIRSILLSTEPASNWDNVNDSFASNNGYQQWGLDARANRSDPRALLGYFRGGFINSSNLYDWGNDRRRVVVLNLVKNSQSHSFREILINQNAYSSANNSSARAAINAVLPAATVTAPLIEVGRTGGGTLTRGTSTVSFGTITPGTSSSISLTIRNAGNAPLTGLSTALSGAGAAAYQIAAPAAGTLAPGATTTFTVTFSPTATATSSARVNVTSTASGVTAFDFGITGTGGAPAPEITIRQPKNGAVLTSGKSTRNFGPVATRGARKTLAFTITNTGNADLTGIGITKSGDHRADFLISDLPRTTLLPGASVSFRITFDPRASGNRMASLQIRSNDSDENPFRIKLTGRGT